MPRLKENVKPSGPINAYNFFLRECGAAYRNAEKVGYRKFSRNCSTQWKAMSEEEQKRFQEMAAQDKIRYAVDMQAYVPPNGNGKETGHVTTVKRRRRKKDPKAPKRSLTAFFWFCVVERPKVKEMNPQYTVAEMSRELGRLWSQADPETKGLYTVMAERDKARYHREMIAYKNKVLTLDDSKDDNDDGDDEEEVEHELMSKSEVELLS